MTTDELREHVEKWLAAKDSRDAARRLAKTIADERPATGDNHVFPSAEAYLAWVESIANHETRCNAARQAAGVAEIAFLELDNLLRSFLPNNAWIAIDDKRAIGIVYTDWGGALYTPTLASLADIAAGRARLDCRYRGD